MSSAETKAQSTFDKLFTGSPTRRSALGSGAALIATSVAAARSPAMASTPATPTDADRGYMAEAIVRMRKAGIVDRTGAPFGAVIVRDGKVLASSGNSVTTDFDPTAHAEVNAIRAACRAVRAPDLQGATLYASCEPCPMCYAAAFWSRIGKIYYAAALSDYDDIWDDKDSQPKAPVCTHTAIPMTQMMQAEAQDVWADYRRMIGKNPR